MLYFDHAATTKPYPEVVEAISTAMTEDFFNPAQLYAPAKNVERKSQSCYQRIAEILSCDADELIQTSGATESTNMAFKGLFFKYGKRLNKIILFSSAHDASLKTAQYLKNFGADVLILSPDEKGRINLNKLKNALDEKTLLVSILYVNNETGVVQDIAAAVKIIREYAPQAYIHADLVQALGKIKLNLHELDIDLASFSAHKIHGPKGVGLLYKRKNVYPDPLIHGGGQQRGLRSGTENYPLLLGMTVAIERSCSELANNQQKVSHLRNILSQGLEELGAIINFPDSIPNILSISFPQYRAETVLHMLEAKGVYVSTSSACNAKSGQISHVLAAYNLNRQQAEGSLRISIDQSNTEAEVRELLTIFRQVIEQLQEWGI